MSFFKNINGLLATLLISSQAYAMSEETSSARAVSLCPKTDITDNGHPAKITHTKNVEDCAGVSVNENTSILFSLPNETLVSILSFIDDEDLLRLNQTCQKLKNLSAEEINKRTTEKNNIKRNKKIAALWERKSGKKANVTNENYWDYAFELSEKYGIYHGY